MNLKIVTLICFSVLFNISLSAQEDLELNDADTTVSVVDEMDTPDVSNQTFVADLYKLPAYELYNKEWNTEYIRIRALAIPFVNDTLQIVLVNESSDYVFPLKSGKVCSPYGYRRQRMHTGTDIKLNLNDTVVSCFNGVVRMAKSYSGYGKTVVVRHYNGLETVYAHLNKIKVKSGQEVKAGQLIGLGGRTGRATTEHLHFETRFLYEHFDASQMIDFATLKLKSDTLILTPKTMRVTSSSSSSASNSSSSVSSTNKDYHIVKKGDTLYSISRKYGVPLKRILQINHIKETSILSIGQKIKLK